ncbi:MAG TPA: hypothetical protein VEZ11_08520 [Thermoanaerobaculia bacterium]|nr:hypothetical protein [Thermoanaerobaculia bacterium]
MNDLLRHLIILGGLIHLAVAASSLAIPRLLDWKRDLASLQPLTRQVFWTYASYTLGAHLAFAAVSLVGAAWLVDGSPLAAAVTGYIAIYWSARVAVQFVHYDRTAARAGILFRVAEVMYLSAFSYLGIVYGVAAAGNIFGARQ